MAALTKEKQSFLEKPIFMTLALNWELVLYGTIFLIAVVTRFYDLGARVMSHDESLHALFSFKLYNGEGYQHDPLMHGPLQFHLVALSYLLFGDNDFSARIPSAIFGIALVMIPYWFRPWLGRIGALITSFGLLISPMLLYYERYIRNEAFILFFTALLALSLFQYMRTRQSIWLYAGAIAVSLSLSAKEVALIHGFIGVVFMGGAFVWERLSTKNYRQVFMAVLVTTLVFFAVALYLNFGTPLEDMAHNFRYAGIILMITGMLTGVLAIATNINRLHKPVSSTILTINPMTLAGPIFLALVLFFLFHTTFLTNPKGAISGTWGAVSYWLAQQEVARGGQPWYYYLMLMPLYEFLPYLLGGIGGLFYLFKRAASHVEHFDAQTARAKRNDTQDAFAADKFEEKEPATPSTYPSDGGTFAAYLILWTIGSFVIYSWAGEKMPWLTVHIALPFIFLMGHVSQTVFRRFQWSLLKTWPGLLFSFLLPLLGIATIILLTSQPFQGQSITDLRETYKAVAAGVVIFGVLYGLYVSAQSLSYSQIKPIAYLVIFTIFSVLTIRFAWLSSFVNYDYVNEFLVYAHGAPDVKWVLDQVDEISQRTVGDDQIKVAYGGVIWPLEWYMREYPNRAFFGSSPNRDALDAPVIIFSPDSEVTLEEVEPYLGDRYYTFKYRQVWWPIEDYKDITPSELWYNYIVPPPMAELIDDNQLVTDDASRWATVLQNRKWLWDIFFYRKVNNHTFNEWPFRTQMYFYVRKDVWNQLWDYRTGLTGDYVPEEETAEISYTDIQTDQPATRVWGSNGSGNGQFIGPRAIAVSPQGQVYVADWGNHRIQVFDQNGTFLKQWGGEEGDGPGQLTEPWGIAVSQDGKVYVADTWNHRIQVFDEDGNYLSHFGSFAEVRNDPEASPGTFWGPRDIVIDNTGNVYVADTGNSRIQKFTADGQFLGAFGGKGVVSGRFDEPVGLTIDHDGYLYVADAWNRRIQKFDLEFNFIAEWEVGGWRSQLPAHKPYLAVDSQNRIYASDPANYRIIIFDTEGQALATFGQYGQDVQSFKLPLDLAIGPDDTLFAVDADNNRVMKFDYP